MHSGLFSEVSFVTYEGNQLSYFPNGYFFKILWWSYDPLANQPPPAAFVRPSGVGGVEVSWKDDFFPAVM